MTRSLADIRFTAIDFETADPKRDSACALGVVLVEGGRIVERGYRLIRPPRRQFNPFCVQVHGITWHDVATEPAFGELWDHFAPFFEGVDFITAHNAPFDRSVLNTCCTAARIAPPRLPYLCTVQLARRTWDLASNKLPDVCCHLGIDLKHHHAASDAEACARIAISGLRENPAILDELLK